MSTIFFSTGGIALTASGNYKLNWRWATNRKRAVESLCECCLRVCEREKTRVSFLQLLFRIALVVVVFCTNRVHIISIAQGSEAYWRPDLLRAPLRETPYRVRSWLLNSRHAPLP